ncbi:MAG: ABC transporter permease [Ignavibacteriales bacterium]|nr:ABC transporter permease [Ignavibacteriales bacterium]
MSSLSLRMLTNQPLRLSLTVFGVALCVILMLFLLGVYNGVEEGSMEYIRHNHADLWVLQQNSWNILRGTSLLSTGHGRILDGIQGVESASAVLLLLPGVQHRDDIATVFLAGYEPDHPLGGPPRLVAGRSVTNDDEIVLDHAFARRMNVALADTVQIEGEPLVVVGLSSGTNAFVIQYAFTTLSRAQYIAGFSTVVSCFLIRVRDGHSPNRVKEEIEEELPGVSIFDHTTFVQNNTREMESGLLPLLFIIAAIGAVVLTAVLSLLLSIGILERRKDFAVMKTLGSPKFFLPLTVVRQALIITGLGSVTGLCIFFPMCRFIEFVTPEMSPQSSLEQIAVVLLCVAAISLVSSLISMQKLRRIYPLEVFQ